MHTLNTNNTLNTNKKPSTFFRFKWDFFLCLTKVLDTNRSDSITDDERGFLLDKKYYAQARKLFPLLFISDSPGIITFEFSLADLTPELRKEFEEFCNESNEHEIGIFLHEIAARFFENINYDKTHTLVLSHLQTVVKP